VSSDLPCGRTALPGALALAPLALPAGGLYIQPVSRAAVELGGGQRTSFPANDKGMAFEGLGAAHGYALCEEGSCEAAEQFMAWRPVVSMP
jgi:hypothetical protein